jgi:maltose alpha-D-glucosyltransferase/alpha-amylase
MQWSGGWNGGFSDADPEQLYLPLVANPVFGYHAVNVAAQRRTPSSLLNWMQRLIRVRRATKALGRGSFRLIHPKNHRILAFARRYEQDTILAVFNLAASAQAVQLDLGEFEGAVPVEMLGGGLFPRIARQPYSLSLGPRDFFWFKLRWLT